jgi:hypothetical protein
MVRGALDAHLVPSSPSLTCHSTRKPTQKPFSEHLTPARSVSGLVVKSIVAIDGPRVRFAADAAMQSSPIHHRPLGSVVERVTSNDKVVSSILAAGKRSQKGRACHLFDIVHFLPSRGGDFSSGCAVVRLLQSSGSEASACDLTWKSAVGIDCVRGQGDSNQAEFVEWTSQFS